MNKNYSGLTSVGSEIISSNVSSQRNLLFSAGKKPKMIIKSYKITNDTSIPDISKNNNNNINNNNISEEKSELKNNNKKEFSLNLSNIKYKDGYILKDAANSNPGFGLWAIKTPIENNNIIKKEEKKLKDKEESKNIKVLNDKELNYKYTKFYDEDRKENIKNKKLMEKLNIKINDLEKKYMQTLSNFQEKKYLCENTIKIKKEFEEILDNNNKEILLIKEKTTQMNNENKKVEDALTNSKNEIERLLNVMKEDEKNMNKIKYEYEIRIIKEKEEQKKLKELIKKKEEQILILNEQTKDLITNNTFFEEDDIYSSEIKKDFEIKKLKEMILNLHIKISGLKKDINNNKQEMDKLNKILRYKNIQDEYQKINISKLFLTVEQNDINEQNKNNILKNQNEIIKNLNQHLKKQYNIITSKKLQKSKSQGMLI